MYLYYIINLAFRKDVNTNAPLAHLVEHLTLNQGVQGSSPWRRTNKVSVLWTKEPWGRCKKKKNIKY